MAITSRQPFFPTCYGKEFTDRLFGLRKRAATSAHEFEHRLTPSKSPQTNGDAVLALTEVRDQAFHENTFAILCKLCSVARLPIFSFRESR